MTPRRQARDILRGTLPGPNRSKYRVTRKSLDGIVFATTSEARRWIELKALEASGEITNLRRQVSYELAPSVRLTFRAKASPALRYTADYVYDRNGQTVVEDVKPQGLPNEKLERDFVMRCHLMKAVHGLDVHVVRVG